MFTNLLGTDPGNEVRINGFCAKLAWPLGGKPAEPVPLLLPLLATDPLISVRDEEAIKEAIVGFFRAAAGADAVEKTEAFCLGCCCSLIDST